MRTFLRATAILPSLTLIAPAALADRGASTRSESNTLTESTLAREVNTGTAGQQAASAADATSDRSRAEEQFRAGIALQKLEDFDAAIAAYESSLRLHATKGALFNLANCLKAIHRYPEAIVAFERLEADYGPQLDEAMRAAASTQMADLRRLTGTVAIVVHQDGARIWVDGRLVGQSPLAQPLRLGVGDHDLRVELSGYQPVHQTLNLGSGQTLERRIVLGQPPATPSEPESAPSSPRDASSPLTTVGWISAGVGGALLIGGTATGIWALRLDSSLERDCELGHCPRSRSSDIDRLETLTLSTNLLLGFGALATAAGAGLLFFAPEDSAPPSAGISWSIAASPNSLSFGLAQELP